MPTFQYTTFRRLLDNVLFERYAAPGQALADIDKHRRRGVIDQGQAQKLERRIDEVYSKDCARISK